MSEVKANAIKWAYIASAYLSLLALGFLDNVRGPFFPDLIRDLSLSDTEASLFYAVTSLVAFVGSRWAKSLLPLLGSIKGLRLGLFLMFFGFAMISQAESLVSLLIYCGIFGLGFGLQQVFQHTAIQEGASLELRRRLFSGLHGVYAAASLLAPLLIAGLIELEWGWRKSFLVFSVLPFLAFLYSLMVKNSQGEDSAHEHENQKATWHMVYAAYVIGFYVAGELSLSTRLVLYVQREFSLSPTTSTFYLAGFFVCLLVGRILFTIFDFKKLSNKSVLNMSLLASTVFYLLGLHIDPLFLSICGLFMAPYFAIGMDYLASEFPKKSATVMSYAIAMGSLVIVAMHFLVGITTDFYGLKTALHIGILCFLLAFVCLNTHQKFYKISKQSL